MAVYTTIDNPELYFQTKLYTGQASSQGDGTTTAITFDGDEDMAPNLIWIKNRDGTDWHDVTDSVRGVAKSIFPNNDDAEEAAATSVTAIGSDGFTVGSSDQVNDASDKYVAWCWKESADAGFDILTFEGNSTDDTDISHNLSAVPHFMIVRNFDADKEWCVYHHKNTSAPETDQLVLNTNAATTDSDDKWSDEAPTSSVFTVGDSSQLNASGNTSIGYLWSEKQGYSKFGSYTGNGNADGTFVYTGFRPAMVIIKVTSTTSSWRIYDAKRDIDNPCNTRLLPNEDGADSTETLFDLCSNGFKLRTSDSATNGSGSTYIYMAFAEAPFVNSNGVPCNAR